MKLTNLLIAAFICTSSANAALVLPVENLICKADVNEWGQSSSCTCPDIATYNAKIGLCTSFEAYPIMVAGVIHSKNAEQDGVSIGTQYGNFDLIVKTSELKKLVKVDQFYFEVEGEFLLIQNKPTIVVDRLSWLE